MDDPVAIDIVTNSSRFSESYGRKFKFLSVVIEEKHWKVKRISVLILESQSDFRVNFSPR